jgi:hypothetical protein
MLVIHRQEIAGVIVFHDQLFRREFIEVVHVERLAREEHHVVADIDDAIDAADAFARQECAVTKSARVCSPHHAASAKANNGHFLGERTTLKSAFLTRKRRHRLLDFAGKEGADFFGDVLDRVKIAP